MSSVHSSSGRINGNVLMALVIVLLGISVAVSGWLIISTMEKLGGKDPYTTNHDYTVTGKYDNGGISEDCNGTAQSIYISETELFTVFTFEVRCTHNQVDEEFSFSIMFDLERHPYSGSNVLVEDKGDIEVWGCQDKDVSIRYTIGSDSIIKELEVTKGNLLLNFVIE